MARGGDDGLGMAAVPHDGADDKTACQAQRRDGSSDEQWMVGAQWPRGGGE